MERHSWHRRNTPGMGIIFLTVFMDLVGFGIVLPLLPIYGQKLQASEVMIGVIMASYSLMQFLFVPVWGRLSDRIGRRPVLLGSTACAALSYAAFGVASTLQGPAAIALLLGSRVIAGICGANIAVAQAYIADITPPNERSRRMGLIGMAFGLGFIFGPALGAVSLKLFGHAGPGWLAAALCLSNFLFAFFMLPESRHAPDAVTPRPRWEQWRHTMKHPQIGLLVLVFFFATFCFTCYETTLGLLVSRNFRLDPATARDAEVVSILFAFGGVIGAVVQGGLIGRLVRRFGESRIIAISLFIVGFSLLPLPFIRGHTELSFRALFAPGGSDWWLLLAAIGALSIGASLTRPPLFGLISAMTDAHEQGATLGVAQSMGSLARIAGPVFAGVYYALHPALPYLVGAGLSLLTGLVTWWLLCRRLPRPSAASAAVAVAPPGTPTA
ncbi:MFS transporter [Fontisphaera persica]|uniref:MFS transporter n=1 Tax=Fontisphaera persica TaxID=2974023 RepID=UPI0024C07163|nr:MFS transporter [Fontisphaera persica]WCJ60773.1 MFS transporter [Fontisphaera persica]